ncbi:hypothetical protein [Leucobacter sp. gxy201]|uniref:hypothetical protein n=1 Tax=Leucobacter sp. gxy201 TaxID=2957200 RepID=UPI003DA0B66C
MDAFERTDRSNVATARRMRLGAIWLLVLGLIGTMGLTGLLIELGNPYQDLGLLTSYIGKVASLFGLPLSAALFAGSMIVRRLPERPAE